MRCPYCNVEYTAGESCFCHAPLQAKAAESSERVNAPWGEAERGWSEKSRPKPSAMK